MIAAPELKPTRKIRPMAYTPRPLPVWMQVGVVVLLLAQGVQTALHFYSSQVAQTPPPSSTDQLSRFAYTYTPDRLVSVAQTTPSTAPQSRYDYDPYGRITPVGTIVTASDFQYAGYYAHAGSGLNLTLYRAYDPNTARWLSRDPIGEEGGINLYGYLENGPINNSDPLGLFLFPWQKPVTVTGGTAEQQKHIYDILDKIFNTPRGKQLKDDIIGPWYWPGSPKTIHLNCNGTNNATPGGPTVNVDPNDHPIVETTVGPTPASTARIVAHEMGHAVTGIHDDGPGQMNNVNQNENPIVTHMGEPARTQY